MTQTLAILVPVAVIAYAILQVLRNRMMIVLVFFIPAFGRSAFLDIAGWVGPEHMTLPDLMFAGGIMAWFYVRVQRPTGRRLPGGFLPVAVLAILGLCVIGALASLAQGFGVTKTLREFLFYSYVWFGFFLWVDILRRFTRDEAWQVVRTVVIVSVPLLALYCLSAMGVHVYPWAPYMETSVGSSRLVRDFATLPPFVFWVVAYYAPKPKRGFYGSVGLVLAIGAIMFSFTRSLLLALAAVLAWYALNVLWSPRRRAERVRALVGVVCLCVISVLLLTLISPNGTRYLVSRIDSLRANSWADPNAAARVEKLSQVDVVVRRESRWFGVGLVPGQVFATQGRMYVPGVVLGDIMWARVYLNLGISGVLAVIAVLGGYLLSSLKCALSSDVERRRIGVFQTMVVVAFIMLTSVGTDFFGGGWGFAFGMAMVLVEQQSLWVRHTPSAETLHLTPSVDGPRGNATGACRST